MRKIISVLLCFCMIAMFCACQKAPVPDTPQTDSTTVPQESTQPDSTEELSQATEPTASSEDTTAPNDEPHEMPLIALALNPVTEETLAKDGVAVFTYTSQDISVYIPQYGEAAQMIQTQLQTLLEESAESVQKLEAWALENYTASDEWVPYSCSVILDPTRLDTSIISFSGELWEYSGGVHPNVYQLTCNFDPETGDALYLADILSGEGMVDALYSMVLDKLAVYATTLGGEEPAYLEGYEKTVAAHFDLENPGQENWYLTDAGMVFSFSPYELASYAAGSIQVELTYEELRGVLKDAFFPIAVDFDETLSINAAQGAQIDQSQFQQVASVTLDAEGEEIALFSGTALYDVELSFGTWINDQFTDVQTLFAANRLTAEDLLLIHASIPDTMPNLSISVRAGEEDYRVYFISQSGEDGSILLLDDIR